MTATVRSFAKINLGLRIGASRADGFHELLTVYQTIALHDVIRISVARGSGIEIRCEDPGVPKDESNTCFRIVERGMAALGTKGRVLIEIEKKLPVQGGLGGASANAVATLLGLERALKRELAVREKLRIAAEVGSDLPLFLVGGTVLGVGRGEQVYPLPDFGPTPCVIVTPQVGVSTPKAFAAWDRLWGGTGPGREAASRPHETDRQNPAGPRLAPADPRLARTGKSARTRTSGGLIAEKLTVPTVSDRMDELSRGLSAWLSDIDSGAPFRRGRHENPLLELVRAGIDNDFEQVVFPEYPELCELKGALTRAGAEYASLSGSGSALFGLFRSREAAATAVRRLCKLGWSAQVSSTLTRRSYWNRMVAP